MTDPKTNRTPREFWVTEREDNTGPYFSVSKDIAISRIEDGDDEVYCVREVIEAPVSESREKEIENEAILRAKRQCSTGNESLNGAVMDLIRIGFEDGATWADAHPVQSLRDEALKDALDLIERLESDLSGHKDSELCAAWLSKYSNFGWDK